MSLLVFIDHCDFFVSNTNKVMIEASKARDKQTRDKHNFDITAGQTYSTRNVLTCESLGDVIITAQLHHVILNSYFYCK